MHRLLVIGATSLVALALSGAAQAWSWPADGDVLRPYTLGGDAYAAGQHRGIDVAGPDGSPVRAPASGTVSFAGSLPTYGRGVTILTDDGYAVTLVHLGAIGVAKGDAVTEGVARRDHGLERGARASRAERSPRHPGRVGVGGLRRPARAAPVAPGARSPRRRLAAPVSAPVAVPVPAPAPPAPPAPGPTPAAASQPAPPASAPSPPAATAAVATPPPAASPAAAAAARCPRPGRRSRSRCSRRSPTPAATGGGSSTADERHAAAAPEPVGAVPTVVASSDTVQARHGSVATPVHTEHRSRVATEAARRPQPTRAAVGDAVASPAVAAPRTRGEEAAPSAARADAVAAPTGPGAGASLRRSAARRVALARKEAPRSGDSPDQLEVGALPPSDAGRRRRDVGSRSPASHEQAFPRARAS